MVDAFNVALYAFAAIGLVTLAGKLRRLAVFTYVYLPRVHERAIEKYRWPARPYALVTAATDGIGKALAKELYGRGFNLIIHGRNPSKLDAVRDDILASGTSAVAGDVRIWCEDGNAGRWDPQQLIKLTEGLDVTVVALVNGGSPVKAYPIDGQSDDEVHDVMSLNFFFSVFVIRTLLPSLRNTATRGPTVLFALGSLAQHVIPPYLSMYAASKCALELLLRGVAADERFAGRGHNLNIKYIQVGSVSSAGNTTKPDFQTPTSAAFAKDILRRINSPWRWAAANPVHAMSAWAATTLLSERGVEKMSADAMLKMWPDIVKRSD